MVRSLCVSLFCVVVIMGSACAQTHEVASQSVVRMATRQPWPRLPSQGDIDQALAEHRAKLGKNVTITGGPSRVHAPWETEALAANKVVLTQRADYSSGPSQSMALLLSYDFMAQRFKFVGVSLPGVKRYAGDKNTASTLEPQDLVYLLAGWVSGGETGEAVAVPPPPAPMPTPPGAWTVNDAVGLAVQEYITHFMGKGPCFGQVIQLGQPDIYQQAAQAVRVVTDPTKVDKRAVAQLRAWPKSVKVRGWPPNELRVSFPVPLGLSLGSVAGKSSEVLKASQKQSLHHELTHQIEWDHDALKDESDPRANRNTLFIDGVANLMQRWSTAEAQVRQFDVSQNPDAQGSRSPLSTVSTYAGLEVAMAELLRTHRPDVRELEAWAGVHVSMDALRQLYLSGACGPGLRDMVATYLNMINLKAGTGLDLTHAGDMSSPPPEGAPDSAPAPAPADHIVYGIVLDQTSLTPLDGAAFTVLKPGVSTAQWLAANFDAELIAARGVSDAEGMVVLDANLEKGQTYSFMVARPGYKPVRYEALKITEASQQPLKITIRLSR